MALVPARLQKAPWWRSPLSGLVFLLKRLGVKKLKLDIDTLLKQARKATGLTDFSGDAFHAPLEILLREFAGAKTDSLGQALMARNVHFLLETRLRVVQSLKDFPAIIATPVRKPLFILGLPRTGTTFLQGLLAQADCFRPYLNWQGMWPAPPPTASNQKEIQNRISHARQRNRFIYALSPGFITAHELNEFEPDECNYPMMTAFQSFLFGVYFHCPDYMNYLFQCDFREAYHWHKTHLQILSYGLGEKTWSLKGPAHLGSLPTLLETYPDACMIFTHRDPAESLPSLASLLTYLHQLFGPTPSPFDAGKFTVEFLERILAAGGCARAERNIPTTQTFDLKYSTLVADPVGCVLKILCHFGYPEEPGLPGKLEKYCQTNTQHRKGKHHYSLKEFGLNAHEVRQKFAMEMDLA